jgi:DNA-directed RNA polymerase subunit RPC12/RpoP
MSLESASSERIVEFARQWGPLGICPHGTPATHVLQKSTVDSPRCFPLGRDARAWEERDEQLEWDIRGVNEQGELICHPESLDDVLDTTVNKWEPIAAWHCFARAFRALADIAANLRVGIKPRKVDWRAAHTGRNFTVAPIWEAESWQEPEDWQTDASFDPAPEYAGQLFRFLMNGLLELAAAGSRIGSRYEANNTWSFAPVWSLPGLPIEGFHETGGRGPYLPGWSLFGALTVQLVSLVSTAGRTYVCDRCGQAYVLPEEARRPRRDKSALCPDCKQPQHRDQARESWRRRRGMDMAD